MSAIRVSICQLGFSRHLTIDIHVALTASDGGRAVFSRLGFEPTGYQEVFLKTSDEQLPVVPIGPHEEVTDISKVDGDIVSRSVMVVRHGNDTFQ